MKRYFLATGVLLLFLSINVFAQTQLDPNIYDENGFRLVQNNSDTYEKPKPPEGLDRETYINQLKGMVPNGEENGFVEGEPASCFDYYTFGSIEVNLTQEKSDYEPGDPVLIRGEITNNNRFPITDLSILARVVKNIPNPDVMRAEIITLEDVIVADKLNIGAGESKNINYSYLLPLNAPMGEYEIFFYAYNSDRFNQAGLSFTNDIVASKLLFNVKGSNEDHVYLDQTRITLNDKKHNVMAFLTNHGKDEPINISIPLVNPAKTGENITVIYELYKWDGLREENIVATKEENVKIGAQSEVALKYVVEDTDTSAYYLKIKAIDTESTKDSSVYSIETQSNIRFSISGYDFPRINSFGVDVYPLEKGKEATLFTCYHNGAEKTTDGRINIKTTVFDDDGNEIASTEFDNKLSGQIQAITNKFISKKDLSNFSVVSIMIDSEGNIIDKIEEKYNCSELNPELCVDPNNYDLLLLGLLILVIVIIIMMVIKIKKKSSTPVFLLLVLLSSLFVGTGSINAAVVTEDFLIPNTYNVGSWYSGDWNATNNSYTTLSWTGTFSKVFNLVKDGINQTSEISMNLKETLSVDNNSTTGYWFLSGSLYDSPPMDGLLYERDHRDSEGVLEFSLTSASDVMPRFSVSIPIEKGTTSISSSDPTVVSCDETGCEAISDGTATVTVSFNDTELTSYYGNKKLVYSVQDEDWNETLYVPDILNKINGDPVVHNEEDFVNKVAEETCGKAVPYGGDPEIVGYKYCYGKEDSDLWYPHTYNGKTTYYSEVGYSNPDLDYPQFHLVKYNENNNGFIRKDNVGFGLVNIWESYQHWYSPEWIEETSYAYSLPDITYTVTVEPNTPQTSTCSSLTVGTDTSNISWTYSDPDGDIQDGYQVQIATSSDFAVDSIVKNLAGSTADTTISIDGLDKNTTYYTRVKTHNGPNGWSEWSTCSNPISISCSTSPSSPNPGSAVTFTANTENVPTGVTPVYTWTDGSITTTGDTYVVNNIPNGNYQVELNTNIDGTTYGPNICTAAVSNICSPNQGNDCGLDCNENGTLDGTIQCNGVCSDLKATCDDDPPVTSTCPLLPEHVSSATYNLFNKDGQFVLTNPITGNLDKGLFDEKFRDKLQYQLDTYVDNKDIKLSDSSLDGNPTITGTTFPISGLVNADCSATLCSLNPNDYGSVDGSNAACSILKQGQSLTTTNGCYNPLGDTSTGKLLVSPNYMEPGEACSITWCAQGTDIANCALFVGGTDVGNIKGMGLSGTASFLMPTGDNAKSQTVQLICQDGLKSTVVQRVDSCKLDPNWTQF